MKTKERIAFDEMNNKVIALSQIIHESIGAAVDQAQSIGFVVTVETTPLQPLAMGNYDLAITTRLNRKNQCRLDDLEAAAIKSEATVAKNIDCDAGLHSWTGENGKLAPDTPCTVCGTLYGNPD